MDIDKKLTLTIQEASEYSGIGINTIRRISNGDDCPFVLYVGNKRMIKRRVFEKYLEEQYSI